MKLLGLGGDASTARGLKGPHHALLEEFHKHWDRIDYLCPHHPEARDITLFGNVNFHVAPAGKLKRKKWLITKGRELIATHKHDVMGVHDYPPFINGSAARRLTKLTGVPHILEIYHIEGHPKPADFPERVRKWMSALTLGRASKQAAAIRVINQTQVPDWLARYGVARDKMKLVYSSYTDLDIFAPDGAAKDIDVLFVGRLVRNKGLNELIAAVAGMTPVPLTHLVGVGPLRETLEADIRDRGLSDRIIFHGWAEDNQEIAHLINRSHLLVCASWSEGGPRTTLEAMACGVPVVTTPVGTMPDMIDHRINGCLADFTAASLRTEINWLLADASRAEAVGAAGRETVLPFERKKLIREYALTYREIARDAARP